jgi:acetyl-CoA acetyltransferase
MRDVYVIGVSTTRFGKFLERSVKSLAAEAVELVLEDGGLGKEVIEAAWFGNSFWGYYSDQHGIRGQVALRPLGVSSIPITNVENACASGSTAFHGAWTAVACGLYDVVIALGVDKCYHQDRAKMFFGFGLGVDMEQREAQLQLMQEMASDLTPPNQSSGKLLSAGKDKSAFMDIYGGRARWHMKKYGTTQRQLAVISSKDHYHGSLNSKAQYRKEMTIEEILADKMISYPLTRPMCSPIADGAAAAILCSKGYLKRINKTRSVRVLASLLASGTDKPIGAEGDDTAALLAHKAYEVAAVGPEDIDIAEVHDATAFGELKLTESLGFCAIGEGGRLAESGATRLGGRIPVNTSGGLQAKGHPIGATGLSQIHEVVTQLRNEAGARQVADARIGLAENGGGFIGQDVAAICMHLFEKANI